MDRRGTIALAFLLTTMLFAGVVFAQGEVLTDADRVDQRVPSVMNAAGKDDPALLGGLVPNKRPDGFPERTDNAAITQVVLSTNNSADPADHVLWLIFTEIWTPVVMQSNDLEFLRGGLGGTSEVVGSGLSFAYHDANSAGAPWTGNFVNVIAVTGLENLPGGALTSADLVRLRNPQRLTIVSASWLPVTFGPAITKVQVLERAADDEGNEDNTGDILRVFMTHQITGLSNGADASNYFSAPEFGTGAQPVITAFTANDWHVDIQFNDNADQGKVRNGITAVRLAGDSVINGRRDGVATASESNDTPQWVCTVNEGPRLLRAGYDSGDDQVTLVFSDDIQTGVFSPADGTIFEINSLTGQYTEILSDDGDNVLVLGGIVPAAPVGLTVDINLPGEVQDWQGNIAQVPSPEIPIVASPIIVLANWRDAGTDARADDRINLYFDVNFDTAPAPGNFEFLGFDTTGVWIQPTLPAPGSRQVNIAGNSSAPSGGLPLWTQGDRVALNPAASITWDSGTNPTPAPSTAWVRDGSAPRLVSLGNSLQSDVNDTAYIAFDEIGLGDDSAYILFYARQNLPIAGDITWIQDFQEFATHIVDPSPGLLGVDLNENLVATYRIDDSGTATDTEGNILSAGDDVFFAAVVVDKEGNWDPTDIFPLGQLVAGPLICPRDVTPTDDDAIHVFGIDPSSEGPYGDDHIHYVCGDPGSGPADGDSVRVYALPGGEAAPGQILLGSGALNSDGSFGPIELDPMAAEAPIYTLYLKSVQNTGVTAVESLCDTPIINDLEFPEVASITDPLQTRFFCYSGNDSLRLLVQVYDGYDAGDAPVPTAINPLLHVWADLSELVTTDGADSLVLVSLGANQVDDDNDWTDVAFGGIQPTFTGNSERDFPEPYVDENGDGVYTPGEMFLDIDNEPGGYTNGLYDYGDANLDVNDPDENGYYYLAGYELIEEDLVADPNGVVNFAVLEDLPVYINVEDNAVLSNFADNLVAGSDFDASVEAISGGAEYVNPLSATCPSFSLEHRVRTSSEDLDFLVDLDSQAPTVSEISYVERQPSYASPSNNPNSNIITPGDNCYTLAAGEAGSFFNLVDSTLSDDDVILVALQIDTGAGWSYLENDPAGDANGDGAPGILDYDDDFDGFMDLEDPEVRDAMQDSTMDAEGEANGVWILTDNIDNDNDAFYRVNPITGGYVWFNIDERTDNNIDDNGDGEIDDAGEVETYDPVNDDDEDGLEDGSAVEIAHNGLQRINRLGAPGSIYVKGFDDPSMAGAYAGGPTGAESPLYLDSDDGVAAWPNDLVYGPNKDILAVPYTVLINDAYGNPWELHSSITQTMSNGSHHAAFAGADALGSPALAQGGPNVIGLSGLAPAGPGVSLEDDATTGDTGVFGFDYRATHGHNLNMRAIKANYGIVDGDEFHIRAVAYDRCFQAREDWAVPLCLITDSTAPSADIPEDLLGDEVCDVEFDGDPAVYTLEAEVPAEDLADVASVTFQIWNDATEMWDNLGQDNTPPYTYDYTYPGPLANDPPDLADTLFFRSIAADQFGNIDDKVLCDSLFTDDTLTEACFDMTVRVVDCTAPMSCLCQIGADYYPQDGAFVPANSAVDLSAWFTDGDGDEDTNDVTRVLFEYRPVGTQTWLPIESLTGVNDNPDSLVDVTGIHHPVITTGPDTLKTTVTWDTREIETGSYDIRATAFDIEGNYNAHMACVYTATVDNVGLRAYIQPCIRADANTDSLFANVYIHDVAVNNVQFQFNNGGTWVTIDTVGVGGEAKGDVILRAGRAQYNWVKDATPYTFTGNFSNYKFWDVDGDGYNPVDPVVYASPVVAPGVTGMAADYDYIVIDTGIEIPGDAELSDFAADEYFADVDGDFELSDFDWILKDNPADGADANLDLWCTEWDVTGLNGCYDIRAVATDVLGNVDNDDDSPIWTEECCIDSDLPIFCVSHYVSAAGDTVEIAGAPECDWVGSQSQLTFIANVTNGLDPSLVDSVVFQYSLDQGFNWETFGVDDFGPDYSAVFDYASFMFVTDTQLNFRAVAWRDGLVDNDPNACKVCLVLGENQGPETDIVEIVTSEGDRLDANTVLRGDADPLCLEPTSLYFLVTAEDNTNIDSVWVMWRKVAGLDAEDVTDWAKLTDAITPVADATYPYEFNWDTSGLTDGVYQFFPRAVDSNGNVTPTFGNPYVFARSTRTAEVVAVEKNGVEVSELNPGEEVVIKGDLDDPSDNEGVAVWFSYAERIEGEMLDVSGTGPYTAVTSTTLYSNSTSHEAGSETVYLNGTPLEYGTDYMINGAMGDGTELVFTAAPLPDDMYSIDYNVSECWDIHEGDDESPYSVAWDADSGQLVPMPQVDGTTHYDIVASAQRIFRGADGTGYASCIEDCVTEGYVLPINDTEAPEFAIHGLLCDLLGDDDDDDDDDDDQVWNAPGNRLCSTCGGTDLIGEFGSCKCKLSGIEHQVFVTGDEDIASVEMSVGGNPAEVFDFYSAEEDTFITMPITFNIDQLAFPLDEVNGFEYKAVNPDSIENVTITITSDGNGEYPGVYNVEMTDVGDGWFRFDANLPIPEAGAYVYDYYFMVDMVGDDQWEGVDECWYESTILIPAEFWCFSTEDPATTWGGVNQLHQVNFTVTDTDGNVSTNLMSGGDPGQLWLTYDPTPAEVTSLWLSESIVGPGAYVDMFAEIMDADPVSADAIQTIEAISIQVSVDDTMERWREIFYDFYDSDQDGPFLVDGGWGGEVELPEWMNPGYDGIDNDRDGDTDESDEMVYTYAVRVVTYDDCCNVGISCSHPRAQADEVCGEITVDAARPQACLTAPTDGTIVPMGEDVTLVAETSDDDVAYVQFWYSTNSGDTWNEIDATPLNDDDDPWVETPEEDGTYQAVWNTGFLARELAGDFFVSIRAEAVDHVDNSQYDDGDENLECDVNIIVNDTTGPQALITHFFLDCADRRPWDPHLALSGEVDVFGRAFGWNQWDVATVTLQVSSDGTDWTTVGVDNELVAGTPLADEAGAAFRFTVDTDEWAEGMWYFRVYATDADGNVQNDEDNDGVPDELVAYGAMVDHTAPQPSLVRVGPEGAGDTTLDEGDLVRADVIDLAPELCPADENDFYSESITFQAETVDPDADVEVVESMWLEFLDDVNTPENPTWVDLSGELGYFEYRDFLSDDENPDGKWVLVVEDLDALEDAMEGAAGGDLPSKEYYFRARGADYACNTWEDNGGTLLRVDFFDPLVTDIYAGDEQSEGGEAPTIVAGGDAVLLTARIRDIGVRSFGDDGPFDDHHIEHETSGLRGVLFWYKNVADDEYTPIGLGTLTDNATPGEDVLSQWDDVYEIEWVTPMNMPGTTDSLYTIAVTSADNAGNCVFDEELGLVAVQDVTPPEDSKLMAIAGVPCSFGDDDDDDDDDTRGNTYPFTPIAEGNLIGQGFQYGIDEAVLSQDLTGTEPLGVVSRTVDLLAATPAGDASMLSASPWYDAKAEEPNLQRGQDGLYMPTVWFEGRVVNADGSAGDWMLIGEGECVYNCGDVIVESAEGVTGMANNFQGPHFVVGWDTEALGPNGQPLWFNPDEDGTSVQIRLTARDAWGNVETVNDDAVYHVIVDNTAPEVMVTLADPETGDPVTTVERNNPAGVMILAEGGDPSSFVNDDLVVEFYWKLSSDLDDAASWRRFANEDEDSGFHPDWYNPDFTRPYAYQWNTNSFRDEDGDPLIPNESYDVSVSVSDLVCNTTDVVGTAKADRHGTVEFIDTMAPVATIVEIERDYDDSECRPGDTEPEGDNIPGDDINWPEDGLAVNGIDVIDAEILDGSTDTQDVRFYFRAQGETDWILADGDVTRKDLDNTQQWNLRNWSTATLTEGGMYELAAVATDDAGNSDANPPVVVIMVDRTGPMFTAIEPVSDAIIVPENLVDGVAYPNPFGDDDDDDDDGGWCDPDERVADIVIDADVDDVIYQTSWANCLRFEWKYSENPDVDDNWNGFDGMVLYDAGTGRYSTTVELLEEFGTTAELVDWRVTATDWAGNVRTSVFATKTVVDNEDPHVEITYFDIDGEGDSTIDPIDNGQITDVSHGDQVTIYATVSDDEDDLPSTHETDVDEVQFFVRHVDDSNWSFLGTAGYDADRGLYSVTWNTTGLTSTTADVDSYYITAFAVDEAANCGEAHEWVEVHVTNQAVPLAQVSAMNPDLLSAITKGTNDRVYGLTFGEREASSVFFQYRPVGGSEWTTIGVGEYTGETLDSRQPSLVDQDLWYSQVRTSDWEEGAQLEFRAVATNPLGDDDLITKPGTDDGGMAMKSGVPGQGGLKTLQDGPFSGLYDLENTPVLRAEVGRSYDGSTTLTPSDDLGYIDAVEFFTAGELALGRIEVDMADDMLNLVPFVVMVGEDGAGAIDEFVPEMDRKNDDKSIWVSGDQADNDSNFPPSIDPTQGALVTVYASAHVKRDGAEDPAPRTEMDHRTMVFHQVTANRGSNGVAGIDGNSSPAEDGYPTDMFAVELPPNAVTSRSALLLTRTNRPTTPTNQEDNIEVLGQSYQVSLVNSGFGLVAKSFPAGSEAMLYIRYNEEDLGGMPEESLTLRTFSGGDWGVSGITHVNVDTDANVITAKLRKVGSGTGATIISVASLEKSPFSVSTTPEWNGWTDQDPIIRGLIDLDGSDVGDRFELYLDGELAVVTDYYDGTSGVTGMADHAWFLYPGSDIHLEYLGDDRVAWEYHHTCNDFDAFKNGTHTVQVGIEVESDDHGLVMSEEMEFLVDANAPYIALHGGFVGNPRLNFSAAYVNLVEDVLTVELYDPESGVLVREDRIRDYMNNDGTDYCTYGWEDADVDVGGDDGDLCELEWVHCEHLNQTDGSFKYDVWVVRDSQEDQGTPDEIEDRTLIYTGTADAVAPYADPPLSEYTPADTLRLPLANLTGGNLIKDGTVLEIAVYSDRLMWGGPTEWDEYIIEDIERLRVFFESIGVEVEFNDETGFYMAYMNGVMDCVWNSGSKYVEQRFIVDQTAPDVTPTGPGVVCGDGANPEPTARVAEYTFSAVWDDKGAGVDENSVEVNVVGPEDVETDITTSSNGVVVRISSKNEGELLGAGTYTVNLTGRDRAGNTFSTNCRFALGSQSTGVTGAMVADNPYNPAAGNTSIHYTLAKGAFVTIKVYDWAGDFVGMVYNDHQSAGPQAVDWAAQTEDGKSLSNGVYFIRIVADDGIRQEPNVVKVAVWNER